MPGRDHPSIPFKEMLSVLWDITYTVRAALAHLWEYSPLSSYLPLGPTLHSSTTWAPPHWGASFQHMNLWGTDWNHIQTTAVSILMKFDFWWEKNQSILIPSDTHPHSHVEILAHQGHGMRRRGLRPRGEAFMQGLSALIEEAKSDSAACPQRETSKRRRHPWGSGLLRHWMCQGREWGLPSLLKGEKWISIVLKSPSLWHLV